MNKYIQVLNDAVNTLEILRWPFLAYGGSLFTQLGVVSAASLGGPDLPWCSPVLYVYDEVEKRPAQPCAQSQDNPWDGEWLQTNCGSGWSSASATYAILLNYTSVGPKQVMGIEKSRSKVPFRNWDSRLKSKSGKFRKVPHRTWPP